MNKDNIDIVEQRFSENQLVNNVENPLKIEWHDSIAGYKVNKPYFTKGELIDKDIADKLAAQNKCLLEALQLCEPFMQDLNAENYEDKNAGMYKDEILSNAYNSMKEAIAKANETI